MEKITKKQRTDKSQESGKFEKKKRVKIGGKNGSKERMRWRNE